MIFYTYMWLRDDGTPYYVGKGTRNRAFVKHGSAVPPSHARILIQEFPDEDAALSAEVFLISFYGRIDNGSGILRNQTDGGDRGVTGYKWAEGKHPRGMLGKKSKGAVGSKHTAEWKAAQSKRMSGANHPQWKGGIKPVLKGRSHKHAADCKHCTALRGKKRPLSEETKNKIRIANTGNKSALGAKRSQETRIKIGAASRARNAARTMHEAVAARRYSN